MENQIFAVILKNSNKIKFRNTVNYKNERKNGTTYVSVSSWHHYHHYFMYKLSFPFHSLLDNGAGMTPKRRSVFSLIFIVNSILKLYCILLLIFVLYPLAGSVLKIDGVSFETALL